MSDVLLLIIGLLGIGLVTTGIVMMIRRRQASAVPERSTAVSAVSVGTQQQGGATMRLSRTSTEGDIVTVSKKGVDRSVFYALAIIGLIILGGLALINPPWENNVKTAPVSNTQSADITDQVAAGVTKGIQSSGILAQAGNQTGNQTGQQANASNQTGNQTGQQANASNQTGNLAATNGNTGQAQANTPAATANVACNTKPGDLEALPKRPVTDAPLNQWFHPVYKTSLFESSGGKDGQWSWAHTLCLTTATGGKFLHFEGNDGRFVFRHDAVEAKVGFAVLTNGAKKSQFMGSKNLPFSVNIRTHPGVTITIYGENGKELGSQATSPGGDLNITLPDDGVTSFSLTSVSPPATFEVQIWFGPQDRTEGINIFDARKR